MKSLTENDIVRAVPQNEAESAENFTFVELVSRLANHTIDNHEEYRPDENEAWWVKGHPELRRSNPYYSECFLSTRLLKIVENSKTSASSGWDYDFFSKQLFPNFLIEFTKFP